MKRSPQPKRTTPFPAVIFDLDGTLIAHHEPIWKTLHTRLGSCLDRRRQVLKDVSEGRLTYNEWFLADVDMLQEAKATRQRIVALLQEQRTREGVHALISALQKAGSRVVIMSGGVDLSIDVLLPKISFDRVFINRLFFDHTGKLTGGESTPYDGPDKATGLRALAQEWQLPPTDFCFVGDGPNDVHIAQLAGMSIALAPAASGLIEVADHHLEIESLMELAPLLGL